MKEKQISLNFAELRDMGIAHIQKFSGDNWTDFNSHDPGVTILEQLCYALTDIAYRTSLPIQSFLAPTSDERPNGKEDKSNGEANKNAFFAPSIILSSPTVTIDDIRKVLINKFEKFDNAWVTLLACDGYQEQLRGLYNIELIQKQNFSKVLNAKNNSTETEEYHLEKVINYLSEIRNLGEDFKKPLVLTNQDIFIDFQIHVDNENEVEKIIVELFAKLYNFIYQPVHFYSFEEMNEAGFNVGEIFSGPKLDKGFIKDEELKNRLTHIHVDDLQKLFLTVKGIQKCIVKGIINKNEQDTLVKELKV
ncbi:MAG: hypothetical protein WBN11_00565, partial [Eudoraea sp.]